MRVTLLGTGTSTGVPVPGCGCSVCRSEDPKNKRLRVSALVDLHQDDDLPLSILIDTSPDLRMQALRTPIQRVDAVLFTHGHADHLYGFDDLRPFFFIQRTPIPIFANEQTLSRIRKTFDYVFERDPSYQGGILPQILPNIVTPSTRFSVGNIAVVPIKLLHGTLEILGFRIGDFAYLTDCSEIPAESLPLLEGLELLILDGLRETPHPTHLNLEGAVKWIERLAPKKTYLTHMSHDLDYSETNEKLRRMTKLPVELGYDGLSIELDGN